ncbi:MAG: amidohydrolase [Leptolyngbyaceae cyanobacterium HOT.MB2.61]|jgi:5-methylthioadenosine/S-adenosylhomocysteine deaminase|nr:amidohydrolase [Leptolyngbyaceae cyanobacterium HOT.MB2.61]
MGCTVIRHAIVFTVNADDAIYPDGTVVLRDNRIVDVGASEEVFVPDDATQTIDCQGRMAVIPGLIDVHSHSSLLRGVTENLQLLDWLPRYQLEHRALNEEDVYYAALLCYLEALKGGTTCVMDMYRFMHRCADAAGVLGMRVNLVPYAADMPGKDFFETPETNRKLIETHHLSQNGRVRVWVGLEHLFYCSKDAFATARAYSEEYGVRIHTHSSEQKEEVEAVVQHFGQRPIALFNELGILGEKTAIAHCVWLNEDEIKLLADTGTSVAHCPTSNAKLAGGIAPILEMKQAGITIGLGTDGNISNNNLDMFEEMKFASLLQKVHRYDAAALSAPETLRMATIEGAKLLGLDQEIGSIEAGKKADLLLVDLWQPNLMPLVWDNNDTNVLWNLVYAARGSNVHTVFVDGEMVVQAGRSTRVNEAEVLEAIQGQTLDHLRRREAFKSTLTAVVN